MTRLEELKARFNGCMLMDGRQKGNWDNFNNKVVHIEAFSALTGDKGDVYYCVTLKEDKDNYYLTGGQLTAMLNEFADVALSVGVEILPKTRTKRGQDFRPIKIVD